jgi:hypothetical protein
MRYHFWCLFIDNEDLTGVAIFVAENATTLVAPLFDDFYRKWIKTCGASFL